MARLREKMSASERILPPSEKKKGGGEMHVNFIWSQCHGQISEHNFKSIVNFPESALEEALAL